MYRACEWREPGFDCKWKKLEILKQGGASVVKIFTSSLL